jgi:chromosome segregation ATPase
MAFLVTLALWGCAQSPGEADRNAKATRLQEEIRALTAARDGLRQELKAARADIETLQEQIAQLQRVVKERDDLKAQLSARTAERDNSVAQIQQIRTNLKALMDQVEAAAAAGATAAPISVSATKPAGQS